MAIRPKMVLPENIISHINRIIHQYAGGYSEATLEDQTDKDVTIRIVDSVFTEEDFDTHAAEIIDVIVKHSKYFKYGEVGAFYSAQLLAQVKADMTTPTIDFVFEIEVQF